MSRRPWAADVRASYRPEETPEEWVAGQIIAILVALDHYRQTSEWEAMADLLAVYRRRQWSKTVNLPPLRKDLPAPAGVASAAPTGGAIRHLSPAAAATSRHQHHP